MDLKSKYKAFRLQLRVNYSPKAYLLKFGELEKKDKKRICFSNQFIINGLRIMA